MVLTPCVDDGQPYICIKCVFSYDFLFKLKLFQMDNVYAGCLTLNLPHALGDVTITVI